MLIAFVIAALALGVLYDAGVSALRAARAASRYEQAVARARSHLALAVHASPLVAGDWQGDDDGGFVWHLRVTPLASTAVRSINAVTLRGSASFPVTLCALTWISHASEASARRNPEFESIINVLQEVGPRPEENSLFFGLPVRYRACAISN